LEVLPFWEYDKVSASQLKSENRAARLCQGVPLQVDEVVKLERN
jgi:hypothetical protein